MRRYLFYCFLLFVFAPMLSCASATADAGQKVIKQWDKAIVMLEISKTTTMTVGATSITTDSQIEISGVVIDPSGLVVTALSSYDDYISDRIVKATFEQIAHEARKDKLKFIRTTKVTAVEITLSDGTSFRAEVIARNTNLDLAFFKPINTPSTPFVSLDLQQAGVPQLLDQVFVLKRLHAGLTNTIAVTPERIQAVVEGPVAHFYVLYLVDYAGSYSIEQVGGAVFDENGEVIGVLTLSSPPDGITELMLPVTVSMIRVIPVADILKLKMQVVAAK